GGMVTTNDADLAMQMRRFRNHGIVTDARQREQSGTWFYEMQTLGFNYRICDIQCALGIQQLKKLDGWIARRRQIADRYDEAFAGHTAVIPTGRTPQTEHAWHLYTIQVEGGRRNAVFRSLRESGIGVNVHYIPVHLHPYYRENFGTAPGMCPRAEAAYQRLLSLPIYPAMSDEQVETVITQVNRSLSVSRMAA
ncbi:MAG: DegT/DnrJ/EryC1/StrS family aminotransferase, partial [Planctomycetaceae bacterium]|nr:DegT/DnrJ/EryC1/StrS family aminotransferase [Planctomycetaceae bacterium]